MKDLAATEDERLPASPLQFCLPLPQPFFPDDGKGKKEKRGDSLSIS